MKQFLAVYTGSPVARAASGWDALDEAERGARQRQGVEAWGQWVDAHSSAIVDTGAPLGSTLRVSAQGVESIHNAMAAFTIVRAESHQAAAAMFEGHPHFTIFPGEAVPRGERPGWLVNVTNDGWFGISSGPYQHFQQARALAIAEGLPLVRAANTGISGVIDPVGRVIASLPLGAEGVLDARLPTAGAPTVYVRFGNYALILFLVVSLMVVGRRRLHP